VPPSRLVSHLHLGEQLLLLLLVDVVVAAVTTVAPLHSFTAQSVLYLTFYILFYLGAKKVLLGKVVEHKDSLSRDRFGTGRTSAYNYKPHH
jgi:hypothetical protein